MLIVALDTSKKEPLYEQIYNSIKEEIITGVLPFGARLPSARRLSKHLDVSRNTVDTAYAQLCAEGYIESKPKRGFHTTFHQQELIWNSFLIISGENY